MSQISPSADLRVWRIREAVAVPAVTFALANGLAALGVAGALVVGVVRGSAPSPVSLLVWFGVVLVPLLMLVGVTGWFALRDGRAGLRRLWRPFPARGWSRRRAVGVSVVGAVLWVGLFDLAAAGWLSQFVDVPDQQVVAAMADTAGVELAGLLVGVTVLAPLWEEVVFRGLLFAVLARRFGFWPAALTSSGLFAALHFEGSVALFALSAPQLLLLGVAMCWLLHRTGSLAAPILFHAAHNAAVAAVVLLT